jgi:hypothetical protein
MAMSLSLGSGSRAGLTFHEQKAKRFELEYLTK